jgi:hypothetical protein
LHLHAAGITCKSNMLSVWCRCDAACAHKAAPQLFGLEEWMEHHAGGPEVPAAAGGGDGDSDGDDAAAEAVVRAAVAASTQPDTPPEQVGC